MGFINTDEVIEIGPKLLASSSIEMLFELINLYIYKDDYYYYWINIDEKYSQYIIKNYLQNFAIPGLNGGINSAVIKGEVYS